MTFNPPGIPPDKPHGAVYDSYWNGSAHVNRCFKMNNGRVRVTVTPELPPWMVYNNEDVGTLATQSYNMLIVEDATRKQHKYNGYVCVGFAK